MKATQISMFFLMMCIAISILNNTNIYQTSAFTQNNTVANIEKSMLQGINRTQNSSLADANTDIFGFLTYWTYFKTFWDTMRTFFSLALNFGGYLKSLFNTPFYVVIGINAIIYVIYFAGLIELFGNKKIL